MDRTELKKYIKENDLEVSVKKSMTDDDLREAIREAMGGDDSDEEEDDEEEEETPKSNLLVNNFIYFHIVNNEISQRLKYIVGLFHIKQKVYGKN